MMMNLLMIFIVLSMNIRAMEDSCENVDISALTEERFFTKDDTSLLKGKSLGIKSHYDTVFSTFACLNKRIVDPTIVCESAQKIAFAQITKYPTENTCATHMLEAIPHSQKFLAVEREEPFITIWTFEGEREKSMTTNDQFNLSLLSVASDDCGRLMVNYAHPKRTVILQKTDQGGCIQKEFPQYDTISLHPSKDYFLCKRGLSGTFMTWGGKQLLEEGVLKIFWRGDATWAKSDHALITGPIPGKQNCNVNVYTVSIEYSAHRLDNFSHDASLQNDTGVYPFKIITGADGWIAFTGWGKKIGIVNRHSSKSCEALSVKDDVKAFALHPSKPYLSSADSSGTIRLWDLATKTTVAMLQTQKKILSLLWNPEGTKLVVGADDKNEPLASYAIEGL